MAGADEARPTFGAWLREQVEARYRSQTEFARAVKASTSAVSRWLNDKEAPKPPQCQRIALALDQPEGLVLTRAGHLKPTPEETPRENGPRALLRQVLAQLEQQAGVRVTRPVHGQERLVAVLLEDGAPEWALPPWTVALVDRLAERGPDALLCYVTADGRPQLSTIELKAARATPGGWMATTASLSFQAHVRVTGHGDLDVTTVLGVVTSVHVPAPLPRLTGARGVGA